MAELPAPGPQLTAPTIRGPALTADAAYVLLLHAGTLPHLPAGTVVSDDGVRVRVKWSRLHAALRLCTPEESGLRAADRPVVAQALLLAGF